MDNAQIMNIIATELPAAEVKESSRATSPNGISTSTSLASPNLRKDVGNAESTSTKRRGFFRRNSKTSTPSSVQSNRTLFASDDELDTPVVPERSEREGDWNVGDEVKMGLG